MKATLLVSVASMLVVVGLAACGSEGSDADDARTAEAETGSALPVADLSATPIADDLDPARRAGAAANLVDCEHDLWQGGWSMDYGPLGSGPTPDDAIAELAESHRAPSPSDGMVAVAQDQGRIAYTYEVNGRSRFAAVVADREEVPLDATDRWAVEVFASCDPAEFDPSADARSGYRIWVDADGARVPTSVLSETTGPEHCEWESVTFLTVDGADFVSDPRSVLTDAYVTAPLDEDAELPADAVDTGYHRESKHLWLAADGRFAFVVDGDSVQAWPATTQQVACA
jgi:hypothetical protein